MISKYIKKNKYFIKTLICVLLFIIYIRLINNYYEDFKNSLSKSLSKNEHKISVLILNYNRSHNLERSINELIKYKLIDDIVILNGHKDHIKHFDNSKVKNINNFEDNDKYYTMRKFKNVTYCNHDTLLLLDDDLYPSEKLLNDMYENYLKDKKNIYGPTKRLCNENGYRNILNKNTNDYNYIITNIILTSKEVALKVFENMKKNKELFDLVINQKGNCEDLLFNYEFIKHYNKKPHFIEGNVIILDNTNGFSSQKLHYKLRDEFCKKIYNNNKNV